MCPICKTDRYLSPDVRFLVNPECYHKICESCVDRIFSLGPAQCPYKRCDKILRKNKFKTQVFDDVGVEKEVDIRKRVFNVFNKTLEDFGSNLEEYNKYLEDLEDIVYKLDCDIDVEKTEEKLRTYEELNRQMIINNIERSNQEIQNFQQRQQFEKDMKRKKQLLEKQIAEEDKLNKEWAKKEIVNRLAAGLNAQEALDGVKNTVKLKKSSARRKLQEINRVLESNPYLAATAANTGITHNNYLTTPFTPFNGDRDPQPRFSMAETSFYNDPVIAPLASRPEYIASGFTTDKAYNRLLVEAFRGLGCVLREELHNNN